jgi:putative oligomerization/nucleic acid binding protein
MGSLSDEQVNQQAATVAASVLNDSVIAATRCHQVTTDNFMQGAGVGAGSRMAAKFGKKMGEAMMPSVGGMAKGMETGGLPKSFILAVTKTQVAALEEKEKKGELQPGKVVKSWPREGFRASMGIAAMNAVTAMDDDHQLITLYLPLDDSKNRYLKASAKIQAAAGSSGQPTNFSISKDETGNAVAEELVGNTPAMPNIQVGGVGVGGMGAPGQAAGGDSTAQLEKLAALHNSGALTDAEFEAQKAKIIGA